MLHHKYHTTAFDLIFMILWLSHFMLQYALTAALPLVVWFRGDGRAARRFDGGLLVHRAIVLMNYAVYWVAEELRSGTGEFHRFTVWMFYPLLFTTVPLLILAHVPTVKTIWKRIPFAPFTCNPFGVFDLHPDFFTFYETGDFSFGSALRVLQNMCE